MSSKAVSIFVIISLVTTAQFCQASANSKPSGLQKSSVLQIYLPREVTIEGDTPTLGQVSIIRGEESLVTMAGGITLGRISVPGQKIVIDRPMLLSRLACNRIPASKVTLTGAEKITVKRQQQIIKGSEFVERALSFLKSSPLHRSVCQLNPMRIPKDLAVPGPSEDTELSTDLAASSAGNRAKVQITVLANGKWIGMREVAFRLKYNCRMVVAGVDIPAGTVITPENIRIEKTLSNYPESAGWSPPYGLIAKRRVAANTVIRPDMVGPVKPAVIVKRNQNVVIRLERPGLLVTAVGKAMQQARAGEYIKVRNIDSRRIILARVNEDGTVEPVL